MGKKTQKTQKRRKGGKFIAEGTSGCVVTPNYRCTPTDEVSQAKISKIFGSKSAFEAEIKESNIFKTIDPTGKYFFKIYNHCSFDTNLNKDQSDRENDLSDCPIKDGKRYMYIGDNAGPDLTNSDFKSKEEFKKVLINILKGLILLKNNILVHRDIKPANLSVTPEGKGMILDYGLVTSISLNSDKKWQIYANMLLEGSPLYTPHENFFILGFVINQDKETIQPFFRPGAKFTEPETNNFFKENQVGILTVFSKNNKFEEYFDSVGVEKNKSGYGTYIYETLTKKYNKLILDGKIHRIQYLKNYISNYDKIDVYALGVSLLEIIKKNRTNKITKIKIIDDFDTEFYDMIDKMIEPDIDKRWNAKQLLNHSYFEKQRMNKLLNNSKQFSKKMANNLLNQYINNSKPIKKTKKIEISRSPINLGFEIDSPIKAFPIKAGKKVRKHQGINQTGGNKGKLKKGYRYSGKKLKSGLPQIIKIKQ